MSHGNYLVHDRRGDGGRVRAARWLRPGRRRRAPVRSRKTDDERRTVMRAIGPVWDGNEVWLLAAGGTLYFAFPAALCLQLQRLLSAADDGAVAADAARHRHRVPHRISKSPCGKASSTWSSAFRASCWRSSSARRWATWFAACRSNADGYFFEPLWTNFRVGRRTGILDWYTVLCGVVALVTLTVHGALYLATKTEGDLNARARKVARLWPVQLLLTIAGLLRRCRSSGSAGELQRSAVGFAVPVMVIGASRDDALHDQAGGARGIPGLLRVYRGHAGRGGVCALS